MITALVRALPIRRTGIVPTLLLTGLLAALIWTSRATANEVFNYEIARVRVKVNNQWITFPPGTNVSGEIRWQLYRDVSSWPDMVDVEILWKISGPFSYTPGGAEPLWTTVYRDQASVGQASQGPLWGGLPTWLFTSKTCRRRAASAPRSCTTSTGLTMTSTFSSRTSR